VIRSPLWLLAPLLLVGTAHAQSDQAQLVRPSDAADLNSHLARLASDPRDVTALIGAGEAALALDDPRAAAGFFARADAIQSGNGRIKAGLGRVMLKMQNPAEALRLFDQAARLRYPDAGFLSDRALARDLTGDQAGAQRDYQAALQRTPDDAELIRRYAASLGISGQVEASDKVLQPLLYKSDRAAWRYRAFILAMNNKQAEAKKIADQTMPAPLASALTPYMQKMPYLTAAQKAAAIHFGHFPTNVGTRIAAVTPTAQPPSAAVPNPATPNAAASTPSARADNRSRSAVRREASRVARAGSPAPVASSSPEATTAVAAAPVHSAQPQPVQPQPAQQQVQPLPPSSQPTSQPAPQVRPVSPPLQPVRQVEAASPAPSTSAVQGPPAPGFESVQVTRAPAAAPAQQTNPLNAVPLAPAPTQPQPAPNAATQPVAAPLPAQSARAVAPVATPQPNPQATRTLADIIHAIDVPDEELKPSVAPVDLAEVAALQAARRAEREAAAEKAKKSADAKAKAEADAKAKKEAETKRKQAEEQKRLAANPSRNWVQIGTGSDKGALAFTLRALRKKYDEVAPQDGWTASWGRTNRLLIGPFSSFTRAKTVESNLKKAGADAFAWQSDAGEVVERIGGK